MNEERIIKLIKSDMGMVVTIVTLIVAILGPWYQVKEQIALINQKIDGFQVNINAIEAKNANQDVQIGQASVDIARIDGKITH